MTLSEEVHIALSNWRFNGLRNFGIIVIDPLWVILLQMAHVVTSMDATSKVSDERRQIVEAWLWVCIWVGSY